MGVDRRAGRRDRRSGRRRGGGRQGAVRAVLLGCFGLGPPARAQEPPFDVAAAVFEDFSFGFGDCTAHLRKMDWNENVSEDVWKVRYARAVNCMRHSQALSREAGAERPAAMAGAHVPTVIVPTEIAELPHLPPFYFVLPFWDMVVSNRVRLFGAYDHQELDILCRLVPPGAALVDVGANVGAVTVPMAAHVGQEGVVYAFEPFRQLFQYLNANVAANGLANVHTFHTALSDASATAGRLQVPAPTLTAGQNAGMHGVFKAASTEPNEQASQTRERMEDVTVQTMDSFRLPRVDVMKIDVEGHAPRVLAGALETLARHRPVLWFEDGGDARPEVLRRPELRYWCTKLSDTTEDQFLCVPSERHAEVQAQLNDVQASNYAGTETVLGESL